MSIPLSLPLSAWDLVELGPSPKPIPIRADRIDPDTGEFLSLTRDRDITSAAVIHTFRTKRDSGAAARTHGHRLDSIRYVEERSKVRLEAEMRSAVAHLERQGLLAVERVRVALGDDWAEPELVYRDLLTQERRSYPEQEGASQ